MWPVQLTAGLFGVSVPRRAGPAVHLRPDRSRAARLRPRAARRAGLHHHRRLCAGAAGGRAAVPGGDPPAHPALDPRGRRRARGPGLPAVPAVPRQSRRALANMAIAGVGSGALVAALPSAAAAAAPLNRTAMATGLTNTTKTIGGAFASAVFGIALLSHVLAEAGAGAGDPGRPRRRSLATSRYGPSAGSPGLPRLPRWCWCPGWPSPTRAPAAAPAPGRLALTNVSGRTGWTPLTVSARQIRRPVGRSGIFSASRSAAGTIVAPESGSFPAFRAEKTGTRYSGAVVS